MFAFADMAWNVLERLALASLQSLLLAVLVASLCRWLPRLGPAQRCWLWWLVCLQLLVGLAWPSPWLLHWLPAPVPAATALAVVAPMPQGWLSAGPVGSLPPAAAAALSAGQWLALALLAAWAVAVAWQAGRSVRDWHRLRHRLARTSADVPESLQRHCRQLAQAWGIAMPPLRLDAAIDSPQLVGFVRPVLLMPARTLPALSARAVEMALRHELAHLRRRDLVWGWIPTLAQHLFLFNPVAWWAAREYLLAREAACDAAVLADPRLAPQEYGRLLLQFGIAPRAVAVAGAASADFISLKRRLVMLQVQVPAWRIVGPIVVVAVAALGVMPYRVVAQPALQDDPAQLANLAAARPAAAASAAPAAAATPAASAVPASAPAPIRAPQAAAPVPPPAPPAPPTPPTPPKPPRLAATEGLHELNPANASVLLDGDGAQMYGSLTDAAAAHAQQRNGESLWWFRQGQARYVVRDAAVLAQLRQAYAPVRELGRQQGELGGRQGELGGRQGKLGGQLGALGAQVASLAAQQAALGIAGKSDGPQARALQERQQALSREMQALAEGQRGLGQQQQALGQRQAELGKRQELALAELQRKADQMAQQAIGSGAAQRLQ